MQKLTLAVCKCIVNNSMLSLQKKKIVWGLRNVVQGTVQTVHVQVKKSTNLIIK